MGLFQQPSYRRPLPKMDPSTPRMICRPTWLPMACAALLARAPSSSSVCDFGCVLAGPGAWVALAYLGAIFGRGAHLDVVRRLQLVDAESYLPECLMTKVDIATMAHSLEVRVPLLDRGVLELGLSLPRCLLGVGELAAEMRQALLEAGHLLDVRALLLGEQLADGGWNCEAANGSTRSSFHSTLNALKGLLAHEAAIGPVDLLLSTVGLITAYSVVPLKVKIAWLRSSRFR